MPDLISIVIRTFNSADVLSEVLPRLDTLPGDQIVIVDSGSTDQISDVAERHHCELIRIPKAEFTYGRALNVGFSHARHEWVLALSSHSVPAFNNLLTVFRRWIPLLERDVVAAVGRIALHPSDVQQKGFSVFSERDLRRGFGFGAGNPNAIYRRTTWALHRFDPELPNAEDCEWFVWAVKAGYRIAAVHEAVVLYESRRGLKVSYQKGKLDYRWVREFFEIPPPDPLRLGWYFLKQCAKAASGRLPIRTPARSAAHFLGQWVEYRRLAKRNEIPAPRILQKQDRST